jgi:hypothetical protein
MGEQRFCESKIATSLWAFRYNPLRRAAGEIASQFRGSLPCA